MTKQPKRWWKSRIHWTNIIAVFLSMMPFVLTYLDAADIPSAQKAGWVLAVQFMNAALTSIFRNSTTVPIGVPVDDTSDRGA